MKKHQILLGAFFISLPFAVLIFLSGEVAPPDSGRDKQELHGTCMRDQPDTSRHNRECTAAGESRGG